MQMAYGTALSTPNHIKLVPKSYYTLNHLKYTPNTFSQDLKSKIHSYLSALGFEIVSTKLPINPHFNHKHRITTTITPLLISRNTPRK
nr:MAG TPA: hypothetical protein [Caudoviricetes sp.]